MKNLNRFAIECRKANDSWWRDPTTNKPINRNKGELLMLVVTELAEAMEGHRKNLFDDQLPYYHMFDVELVDALIRIFDLMGEEISIYNTDYDEIYKDKMKFNSEREDHKPEHRLSKTGKKC